jgi:hypothetical protein
MPIRINLLAEAQALEEMRRRDPVKRAIWAAGALVSIMLAWSLSLQLKAHFAHHELSQLRAQFAARAQKYQLALDSQRKLDDVNWKLAELQLMATNRLLCGTLLNALQQTTIDDVQLLRFRTDQGFTFNEEVKTRTNANDQVIPGKPASVTEKSLMRLEARDSGVNPGDQVTRFKRALAENPYFQALMGKTNEVRLTSLSPPNLVDGRPSVQFALEYRFPDKTR